MSLEAHVVAQVGGLGLDVELTATAGELVVVVGPNGAGKTTLLRALAGLLPLDAGRVELDGVVLDDPAAGVHVDPADRAVGFVFQDHLLFPHLSALDNAAFGLRARGIPRGVALAGARTALARLGVGDVAARRPGALSGGEAQRVALARALVTEPRLLLLDEPLAALDRPSRPAARRVLAREITRDGGVRVLVTHDPLEALTLADRLVVLEAGRVVQAGLPASIATRPRSRYVADFVGLNLYRGRADGQSVTLPGGGRLAAPDAGTGEVFAVVHPRAVALHRSRPEGTPRNVWPGEVATIDPEGDRMRVRVRGPVDVVAEVTLAGAAELRLAEGEPVWVAIKATEVEVYPA